VFVDQRLQQSKQPLYLDSQYESVHPSRHNGESTNCSRCKRYAAMKPFRIGHGILRHGQGRSADLDCHQHPNSLKRDICMSHAGIRMLIATARSSLRRSGGKERVRNLATSRDTTWRVPRVEALLCTAASEDEKHNRLSHTRRSLDRVVSVDVC
jgi:hypothetical protein